MDKKSTLYLLFFLSLLPDIVAILYLIILGDFSIFKLLS